MDNANIAKETRMWLALFAVMTLAVGSDLFRAIDLAALDLAQAVHAPWLDLVGSVVGLFGQAEVTAGIALGLAVARMRAHPRDAFIPLFIVLTVVIEAVFKTLVPQASLPADRSRTIELLPSLHVAFANSFPSGHVARSAFLLGIARGMPRWAIVTGIVLMVLTRVYLGEHWLSDTLGGAFVGLAVASFARRSGE